MQKFDKDNYVPEETKSGRVIGSKQPISIGTAIALETVTLEEPEFEVLMINVYTLFRNFWGSWNNSNRPPLKAIFPEWLEELEVIEALIKSMNVKVVFFKPDYSGLQTYWPDAKIRIPKTDNQKLYQNAERIAINAVANQTDIVLAGTGLFMPIVEADVFLMSHQPMDLLSISKYTNTVLLESHTAEVKEYGDFHTKIDVPSPRLGFNHFTMILYGDKGKLFGRMPNKYRLAVENLAEKKRWNHGTTAAKMEFDIKENIDKETAEVLLRILRKKPKTPAKVKVE